MIHKKISTLTPEAKRRLALVGRHQKGELLKDLAKEFNIHTTTAGEWVKYYEESGIEGLKRAFKPRPVHTLDTKQLKKDLAAAPEKDRRRLSALLDLANGAGLNDTAAKYAVSPQGLAKWRRLYLRNNEKKC